MGGCDKSKVFFYALKDYVYICSGNKHFSPLVFHFSSLIFHLSCPSTTTLSSPKSMTSFARFLPDGCCRMVVWPNSLVGLITREPWDVR